MIDFSIDITRASVRFPGGADEAKTEAREFFSRADVLKSDFVQLKQNKSLWNNTTFIEAFKPKLKNCIQSLRAYAAIWAWSDRHRGDLVCFLHTMEWIVYIGAHVFSSEDGEQHPIVSIDGGTDELEEMGDDYRDWRLEVALSCLHKSKLDKLRGYATEYGVFP